MTTEELVSVLSKPIVREIVSPETGNKYFIRRAPVEVMDRYELELANNPDKYEVIIAAKNRLAVSCLCDESGKRLLGDDTDISKFDGSELNFIYQEASYLNGLRKRPEKKDEKKDDNKTKKKS